MLRYLTHMVKDKYIIASIQANIDFLCLNVSTHFFGFDLRVRNITTPVHHVGVVRADYRLREHPTQENNPSKINKIDKIGLPNPLVEYLPSGNLLVVK